MDEEEPSFPQSTSANFILLPSQDETQQSQEMAAMLKTLPALQAPATVEMDEQVQEEAKVSKIILPGDTSTETDAESRAGDCVLVADSEFETKQEKETTETSVSESQADISDGQAEVTVVRRTESDSDLVPGTEVEEPPLSPCEPDHSGQVREPVNTSSGSGSPSNESSFQSRDRSGLGSYDQCELYRTQQGHARGDRFSLFQPSLSQQDMFGDTEREEEERTVATPSSHLGSLQLSGQPMLVPETVDDADREIPPSPNAYASTPMIIPGSPTDEQSTPSYDMNAANTLSDFSKGFEYKGSSSGNDSSGESQKLLPLQRDEDHPEDMPSSQNLGSGFRPGPTLLDDDVASESLHLRLSESHRGTEEDSVRVMKVEIPTKSGDSRSLDVLEYVTETPTKKSRGDKSGSAGSPPSPVLVPSQAREPVTGHEADVIVIDSGSGPLTQPDEEEEELSLRLTPSQITQSSRTMRSQKSQKSQHKRRKDVNDNSQPWVTWQGNEQLEKSERKSRSQPVTTPSATGKDFGEFRFSSSKTESPLHPSSDPGQGKGHRSEVTRVTRQGVQSYPHNGDSRDKSQPRGSAALTIGMITAHSESASERTFRIDEPDLPEMEVLEDHQRSGDVFQRVKERRPRKQLALLPDDSDEEIATTSRASRGKRPALLSQECQVKGHRSLRAEEQTALPGMQADAQTTRADPDVEMQDETEPYEADMEQSFETVDVPVKSTIVDVPVKFSNPSVSQKQGKSSAGGQSLEGLRMSDRDTRGLSEKRFTEIPSNGQGSVPDVTSKRSPMVRAENENITLTPVKNTKRTRTGQGREKLKETRTVQVASAAVATKDRFALPRTRALHRMRLSSAGVRKRRRHASADSYRKKGSQVSDTSVTVSEGVVQTRLVSPTQGSSKSRDPFTFHSSQSQNVPEDGAAGSEQQHLRSASLPHSPLSSGKKGRRLQHRKSGLLKSQEPLTRETAPAKHHVWFQSSPEPSTQQSDVTRTTTGSLASLPSSISQSSSAGGPIMSPRITTETSSMLERNLSLEQLPADTLPLFENSDENYQKVTEVTRRTFKFVTTETKVKVIDPQGNVVNSSASEVKGTPFLVEENTNKRIQYIAYPSPSRSTSTLTSGDYGDISSSLSRSSGSYGSKVSINSGSLDRTEAPSGSLDHSEPEFKSQGKSTTNQVESTTGPTQESADLSKPDENTELTEEMVSPANQSKNDPQTASMSGLEHRDLPVEKGDTLGRRRRSVNVERGGVFGVSGRVLSGDSDEFSSPHEASTINRTGSALHSRTVSLESPKTSDIFTTPDDSKGKMSDGSPAPGQRRLSTRRSGETSSSTPGPAARERNKGSGRLREEVSAKQQRRSSEGEQKRKSTGESSKSSTPSDYISPEIPIQSTTVSEPVSRQLVVSSGEKGSRVFARWKDDFFYPGAVKTKDDKKCQVRFDDGDSLSVKLCDVLLVEELPVGQSVLVLTKDGDYESGMITTRRDKHYVVETDRGVTAEFTDKEVILSTDQASVLVSDQGSDITMATPETSSLPKPRINVGDVCLDNLVEGPRRSSIKKSAPNSEVKDSGKTSGPGSSRGKRKLSAIEPQATSTPTPLKSESVGKRRKVDFDSSPLVTPQTSSNPRRSPRKARVGLFGGERIPPRLFHGMLFMLTNVVKSPEQKAEEKRELEDSSLEVSTDDSVEEAEMEIAVFDKVQLHARIEAGGGEIMEKYDQTKVDSAKSCFVVSSSYQRTFKYLQGLAAGLPCISHMWVLESCKEGKLQDQKAYVLPAGISLEKRKLMEWKAGRRDALLNVKAMVISVNSQFWSSVMSLAKCTIVEKLPPVKTGKKGGSVVPDVLVTDSTCPAKMLRQAEQLGVAVVSTEWVVQSIISGRPAAYNGHDMYRITVG